MEQGNLGKVKSVDEGVLEYKIDFGPDTGSIRARRRDIAYLADEEAAEHDINAAITYWQDYKRGKRGIR